MKIQLECGEEIKGTKEHPILTNQGWKNINELKEGDFVAELRNEVSFEKKEPYLYELLPKNKIFVVNKNNFFQKEVDNYIKINKLDLQTFSKVSGIPYLKLIDLRRLNGRRKSIRLDYFLKVCELCNLSKESYLSYLENLKTKGPKWPKWPLKLTKDIMWLAGIVATDGCIVKSKGKDFSEYYKIKIGNKSKVMIDKIKEIVKYFEIRPYVAIKDGLYHLEFGSNLLSYLFMSLGIPCKNKSFEIEVGERIFSLPNDLVYAYLEGVFEGDGNLNIVPDKQHGMIRLFSASKGFAIGLHKLISRLGIENKIRKDKIKTSKLIKKVSDGMMYCVGIFRKEGLKQFFDNCLAYGERAIRGREFSKNLEGYLSLKQDFNKYITYSKIIKIELIGKERIYNLNLKNEPSNFIVGNIITHNCGRAGHKLHENPRGEFIVLDRDDLVECSVLMKNMIEGKIDKIDIPKNCLDVLSQQIYGMAISKVWDVNEMLGVIRKSYCYSGLSKEDFFDVISYLAGEYALEHRNVYAKIWYDPKTGQIGKRGKMARVIYMTNIGTIPEEGFMSVVIQDPVGERGKVVGKIDELFLEKMKRGDIFVLGGGKYQFLFARGMKAYVKAGVTKNPTIPSWFSEQLPLSFDVALDIGRFRKLVKERLGKKDEAVKFIQENVYVKKEVAEEIYKYIKSQKDFSEVPDSNTIVIEKIKEEKEYLIFHSLYGRRVNDALARAYAFGAARLKYRDIEMGINDNGFFIAGESLDAEKILKWVKSSDLRAILKEAVERTEVLGRRFRHCAARSLMILRNYKGREKSVGKQQVHSLFLLSAVRKISNEFPILREARREVFEDLMDVGSAEQVLKWIENGTVKVKFVRNPIVSPFGLGLMMQGRSDLIKMEDRANFLKRMHELQMKIIDEKRK